MIKWDTEVCVGNTHIWISPSSVMLVRLITLREDEGDQSISQSLSSGTGKTSGEDRWRTGHSTWMK